MKLLLLACEIFYRELCATVARSPHQVDLQFLPKGLHDLGSAGMVAELQKAVDAVPADKYDAILLGYALCNNGVIGLRAGGTQLVLPRAHDCITLFLGSRERYSAYFNDNPGAYYLTTGWLERGGGLEGELAQLSVQHQTGMDRQYQELVDKYGEDNAKYIYEQLVDCTHNYTKYTYIEMGVEPDGRFESNARRMAADKGWEFEKLAGDLSLIQGLVNGDWPDRDYLTVAPGKTITADYHPDRLVTAK